jgi:hypothetical protein
VSFFRNMANMCVVCFLQNKKSGMLRMKLIRYEELLKFAKQSAGKESEVKGESIDEVVAR